MNHDNALRILNDTFTMFPNIDTNGIPENIKNAIASIMRDEHLTFRYMLFTALLAKACDPSIHPRAIQAQANLPGAYDARSLCHKVIVPFEKTKMEGRLGDSNEPFLNKPARCEMVDKSNPVRGGRDHRLLCCLYDLLEEIQSASPQLQRKAFEFAFLEAMQRPPRQLAAIVLPEITATTSQSVTRLISFMEQSYEGEAPVAILGAVFHFWYSNAEIRIHPANEAGSSSNQVGDIDIVFPDGRLYAVEVKDKPYTETDVDHAVGKVRATGHSKAIFAYGMNCGCVQVAYDNVIIRWASLGVDLSFVSIREIVVQFISMCGEIECSLLLRQTLQNLYCMRAKDGTIHDFLLLFDLQGQ